MLLLTTALQRPTASPAPQTSFSLTGTVVSTNSKEQTKVLHLDSEQLQAPMTTNHIAHFSSKALIHVIEHY